MLALHHFQLVKPVLGEPPLSLLRRRDALEAGMREDDGVPIPGAAEELLPVRGLEILLAGDQESVVMTTNLSSAELLSFQHTNEATQERHVLTRAAGVSPRSLGPWAWRRYR